MISHSLWLNYTEVGRQAFSQGNHALAEKMFRAAAEEAARLDRPERHLASTLTELAITLHTQNKTKEAASLYKQALALLERLPGKQQSTTARALDGLAELYFRQGEYRRARPLYKRLIALSEEQLGPGHPALGAWLIRLSWIYTACGHQEKAHGFFCRAQQIRNAPPHPC